MCVDRCPAVRVHVSCLSPREVSRSKAADLSTWVRNITGFDKDLCVDKNKASKAFTAAPEGFLDGRHSPTETSWAKASEMRRRGRPTATQVTNLSKASSVRTLRYRAWFGSFNRKSLNTYSVATCAMAISPLFCYIYRREITPAHKCKKKEKVRIQIFQSSPFFQDMQGVHQHELKKNSKNKQKQNTCKTHPNVFNLFLILASLHRFSQMIHYPMKSLPKHHKCHMNKVIWFWLSESRRLSATTNVAGSIFRCFATYHIMFIKYIFKFLLIPTNDNKQQKHGCYVLSHFVHYSK